MSEDSWEAVWPELSDGGGGGGGSGRWLEREHLVSSPLPRPPRLFESKLQPLYNFIHRYLSLYP